MNYFKNRILASISLIRHQKVDLPDLKLRWVMFCALSTISYVGKRIQSVFLSFLGFFLFIISLLVIIMILMDNLRI